MLIFIFLISKNPLKLRVILILFTLFISLLIKLIRPSSVYSFTIFIIIIRSIIVLFIYLTRLIRNLKFKINLLMIIIILIIVNFINPEIFYINFINLEINSFYKINFINFEFKNFSKLIINKINFLIYTTLFLFLTLIINNKITWTKLGPIRKKN